MEKYINDYGKEVWRGINYDTPFTINLFNKIVDEKFNDSQLVFHSNLGSITIVDRLTGYGFNVRDIETGYLDSNGYFWLATCGCNVLQHINTAVGDAIDWIKLNANTCVGIPSFR